MPWSSWLPRFPSVAGSASGLCCFSYWTYFYLSRCCNLLQSASWTTQQLYFMACMSIIFSGWRGLSDLWCEAAFSILLGWRAQGGVHCGVTKGYAPQVLNPAMILDGATALSHALEKRLLKLNWWPPFLGFAEGSMASATPVGLKWDKHSTIQRLCLVCGMGQQTEYIHPMCLGKSNYPSNLRKLHTRRS